MKELRVHGMETAHKDEYIWPGFIKKHEPTRKQINAEATMVDDEKVYLSFC